jgi:hypothetical protein
MLTPHDSELLVVTRLFDFFRGHLTWSRRLWNIGTVLTLKEVMEAAQAVAEGALTSAALRDLCRTAEVVCGRDPASGTSEERRLIQSLLRQDLKPESHDYMLLSDLSHRLEQSYLIRWSDLLTRPAPNDSPESVARAIASHLLDSGLHPDRLHRWWNYKVNLEAAPKTLAELVTEAHQLVSADPQSFDVMVAFSSAPRAGQAMPQEWRTAAAVVTWLREHGFELANVRQGGGLLLSVRARDPWSAVDIAAEMVSGLVTRLWVGAHARLVALEEVWVAGQRAPFKFRSRGRGVDIGSLDRQSNLYVIQAHSQLDAALELVAGLDEGPPASAVAGAWAAIESLLIGPGDSERVIVADRLANLVACSLARSELTTLAHRHRQNSNDRLAQNIAAAATNRERARLVADWLSGGNDLSLEDASDRAAQTRMLQILRQPRHELGNVQAQVSQSLRRLYRQRNLVLHWGRTRAVSLRPCIRSAAPLIGAGIDRIAHGWFTATTPPLELASRARLQLELVGSTSGRHVVDLLEPNV